MSEVPRPFVFVHSNRRIVSAWGALEQLAELAREHAARRCAVVMDGYFRGGAVAARIAAQLQAASGTAAAFHFVPEHEPDVDSVEACTAALAAADPDLVLAVGGGSALDTAKVARLLLANPGTAESAAGTDRSFKSHRSTLIAIPTVAGAGSEVSESAIVGKPGADIKLIYRSQEMTPQIALLDGSLTVSAPPKLTAMSGYDAVTHAVQPYVSRAASVMSDPFAESALRLLGEWLPIAHRQPDHAAARSWCLIASCQAAIAFNSAHLGLAHAVAAPLAAIYHVPHGLGNALALPAVAAYNERAMGSKAQLIAACLGAATAAAGLARLRHGLALDIGLDQFVPSAEDRERLAQATMRSGQLKMNPRLANIDDMRLLIEAMRFPSGDSAPQRVP